MATIMKNHSIWITLMNTSTNKVVFLLSIFANSSVFAQQSTFEKFEKFNNMGPELSVMMKDTITAQLSSDNVSVCLHSRKIYTKVTEAVKLGKEVLSELNNSVVASESEKGSKNTLIQITEMDLGNARLGLTNISNVLRQYNCNTPPISDNCDSYDPYDTRFDQCIAKKFHLKPNPNPEATAVIIQQQGVIRMWAHRPPVVTDNEAAAAARYLVEGCSKDPNETLLSCAALKREAAAGHLPANTRPDGPQQAR